MFPHSRMFEVVQAKHSLITLQIKCRGTEWPSGIRRPEFDSLATGGIFLRTSLDVRRISAAIPHPDIADTYGRQIKSSAKHNTHV